MSRAASKSWRAFRLAGPKGFPAIDEGAMLVSSAASTNEATGPWSGTHALESLALA
jgi:hypothetical protein